MRISWNKSLPLGTRVGLLGISLVVLLAACTDTSSASLFGVLQDAAGAPRVHSVVPQTFSGGGGETVTLEGTGFATGQVVWIGETLISDVAVVEGGKQLSFEAPSTRPGAAFDIGVGRVDAKDVPTQRSVLPRGFSTRGLSGRTVAWIGVGLAVLALLGTPLFIVIGATTCLGLYLTVQMQAEPAFFTNGPHDEGIGGAIYTSWLDKMGTSSLFIAIPLFTFAGTLMSESKAPTRVINVCRAILGWLPGGLALVTLVTCCLFTAFTGASGVTIIALGGLLFPILLREKYPERFSLGLLTTGGSLGLLFVPSLPVIIYGLVARVDIERLFLAAVLPGVILVVFLFATCFAVAIAAKVPRHQFSGQELLKSVRGVVWELPLPVLVVGGIYSGVITAPEASAVTAFYVIVTTVFVYKDVKLAELLGVVRRASVLVGAILMIMGTALGFTDWLTIEEIPQKILGVMQEHIDNRVAFLISLNIFLLVVGCLMDIFSAILVVVPLIGPVAHEFGVDPYHLAVIFLVNLEIGYSTPPVGINLFIASLRFRRPVFALYRASVLFIGVLLVALMLITYVPAITLGFFSGMPSMQLLDDAEKPMKERITVKAGEGVKIKALMRVGGVSLEQAKAERKTAMIALEAAETKLGKTWDDLEETLQAARDVLSEARKAGDTDLSAPKAAVAAVEEAREPLVPEATALREARKFVDTIRELQSKVKWRSRLDKTKKTGQTFDTSALGVGEHILTATAEDSNRHVVQHVLTVVVEGTPAPAETPGEDGGDGDWGDGDGDWGDGDWGGDEKPADETPADTKPSDDDWGDGDWGDGK